MKVIYIAGLYTGTPWQVHENIFKAQQAGIEVARLGAMPLIPHSNTPACFIGTQDPQFWYDGTMELLRRCDAARFITDWRKSKGARDEYDEAVRLSMPTFFDIEGLKEWLSQ